MADIFKRVITGTGIILMVFVFTLTAMAEELTPYGYIEEDADMVLPSDRIITGNMNKYSKEIIVVDDAEYRLCRKVKVFSERGEEVFFEDIATVLAPAEKVKIFFNEEAGCVRKITILRSAQ